MSRLPPMHVLVVDDQPDALMVVTEMLARSGHHVETVASGRAALDTILLRRRQNDGFDLVISDIVMPEMDGLTLAEEMRHRDVRAAVAFMTGHSGSDPSLRHRAKQAGAAAFIEKPVNPADIDRLCQMVAEQMLQRHQSESQRHQRRGTASTAKPADDGPFFGTARIASGTPTNNAALDPQPANTSALTQRHSGLTPRQGVATGGMAPQIAPASSRYGRSGSAGGTAGPSSATFRRSNSGTFSGGVQPGSAQIPSTTTSRIRRSVGGKYVEQAPTAPNQAQQSGGTLGFPADGPMPLPMGGHMPQPQPPQQQHWQQPPPAALPPVAAGTRMVACAHCGQAFAVLAQPQSYVVSCIHCAKLNRIDP